LRRTARSAARKERQGDGKPKRSHGATVTPKLSDLGVSKTQSSRWQRLAELCAKDFEAHVERGKQKAVSVIDESAKEALRKAERAKYVAQTKSGCSVADLTALAQSGRRFGVIYADPPRATISPAPGSTSSTVPISPL
jgi:threonine synthase